MQRKGIILAGGSGTRLFPATISVSKQLMAIYDKPMIYYPLATLMSAGIKEVLIITRPEDSEAFQRLLGDGARLGIKIQYETQAAPRGLADAFIIGRKFLNGSPVCMILGDNLFYGGGCDDAFKLASESKESTVFGYRVQNPSAYGVFKFAEGGTSVTDIIEKPQEFVSNYCMPGIYFFDEMASDFADNVQPSKRGEIEIVDVVKQYLNSGSLNVVKLNRTVAWLDTGTASSMMEASEYVKTIEHRQGFKIGCIEEIAYGQGWIDAPTLEASILMHGKSEYAEYLKKIKAP